MNASDTVADGATRTAIQLQTQWRNPSNVASILLIVAGDIVGEALAQLSGPTVVPVVFSFGWVSYAHKALVNAIGLRRLLKPKDNSVKGSSCMVDIDTGKKFDNRNVLFKQVLDDWEFWKPREVKEDDRRERIEDPRNPQKRERSNSAHRPGQSDQSNQPYTNHEKIGVETNGSPFSSLNQSLRTVIFDMSQELGSCTNDRVWVAGIACALVQLGIASVPCALYGDWAVLLVTGLGTILAFVTGSLPQFGKEKWGTKRKNEGEHTVALIQGDPQVATEIMVIRQVSAGLDLEDLAKGTGGKRVSEVVWSKHTESATAWPWTRSATGLLAACWIALLIVVSGLQGDSWYLLAVGALGMLQNGFVAASPRMPAARGLHLDFVGLIRKQVASEALVEADAGYGKVGRALLMNMCPDASPRERHEWWLRHGNCTQRPL